MLDYRNCRQRLLELYSSAGFRTKLFVFGRLLIAPLRQTASYVPDKGTVLDIGCGYGVFSNLLALASPARLVIGMDVSEKRIIAAQKTVLGRENIQFVLGDVTQQDRSANTYDAIVAIDLLHHIPYQDQRELIRSSYCRLDEEGLLIIKDVDVKPSWKLMFSYMHDIVINRTYGRFFFVSSSSLEAVLNEAGFEIRYKTAFRSYPYAHILYVSGKRRCHGSQGGDKL